LFAPTLALSKLAAPGRADDDLFARQHAGRASKFPTLADVALLS
jgi:hypothetical protein